MRKTLLTKLALLLVMLVGVSSAWADTVTFDATKDVTANAQSYQTTEVSYTATDGSVWKANGYGATANTNLVIGKGGANYLETPNVNGTITSVAVTWSGNTSYYLALQTTDGKTELEAKSNPSSSTTETFTVSGTYSQLRLVGRRSSGTNNAAATITKVVVTYTPSSSGSLSPSDLAITGDPVALSFDLYTNSTAQTVSFTTSSTGAVTVSESEYVTTSVSGNTITVTPVKVTPSVQTITVNQAADDTYAIGSATFTVSIANSAPYVQPTEFDINLNDNFFGTTYGGTASGITDDNPVSGTQDNVTVTYAGSGNHYINDRQIRFYPNNKLTFEAPNGYEITEIAFTSDGTWAATISAEEGTYNATTKTWTGNATSVVFAGSGSSRCDISKASIKIAPIGSAVATTTTIDATGITNTNVYSGTAAGSLSAAVAVTESGNAVSGATVTWSGDNDAVATIDAATGAVTLVAAGTVTFTASYAGVVDEYKASSATYELTVTNTDPNAPGTESNPYTVAEAIANTPSSGTSANVYIKGKVSSFYNTSIMGDGSNFRYYISDDGTTTNQLLVYKGKGLNNTAFSSAGDLLVGDEVVICGGLMTYQSAPEVASGNYIVKLTRPATILLSETAIDVDAEGGSDVVTVTTNGVDTTTGLEIVFYESDGTTPATYDWVIASINADGEMEYLVEENEGAARTAYLRVYGLDADANDVYSNLVTITQAKPVVDYATLPFAFNDKKNAISDTEGLSHSGLGSDYAAKPYLKFDGTGDNLILKINENPGILSFDIEGNGFKDGTFTVQTSVDGTEYSELIKYTNLGTAQTDNFVLPTDVRYIKWIYTEKVDGNVGLGNIKLSKEVKVTSNGWATYIAPCKMEFGAGNAYIVTVASVAGGLTLTEVTKVDTDEPILLKGEGTKTPKILAKATDIADNGNLLSVCNGTIESGKFPYVLAKEGAGAAFKQWTGEASVLNGRVVLLLDEDVSAARSIFMLDGDNTTTGIAQIENEASKMDGSVYNLNGQRVNSPKKGLYIVNGKKVMMK